MRPVQLQKAVKASGRVIRSKKRAIHYKYLCMPTRSGQVRYFGIRTMFETMLSSVEIIIERLSFSSSSIPLFPHEKLDPQSSHRQRRSWVEKHCSGRRFVSIEKLYRQSPMWFHSSLIAFCLKLRSSGRGRLWCERSGGKSDDSERAWLKSSTTCIPMDQRSRWSWSTSSRMVDWSIPTDWLIHSLKKN